MKNVLIIGGDGFCGWPTALHLSNQGHHITIVDNFARRDIDTELGANSLTPIKSMDERLTAWNEATGKTIAFEKIDAAADYNKLEGLLAKLKPDTIIHFGEQRAAPYSMKGNNQNHEVWQAPLNSRIKSLSIQSLPVIGVLGIPNVARCALN